MDYNVSVHELEDRDEKYIQKDSSQGNKRNRKSINGYVNPTVTANATAITPVTSIKKMV